MDINKRRTRMKAFIESQFGYCPLVWMRHSRTLNTHINSIHERALRLVYNDYNITFSELLKLDNYFTVHERNIQTLAIVVFKVVHNLSPDIMNMRYSYLNHPRSIVQGKYFRREMYAQYIMGWKRYHLLAQIFWLSFLD